MEKTPLVLGVDPTTGNPILQQIQPGDVAANAALPFDRETQMRRLFRLLLADLASQGLVTNPDLINELGKLRS